MLEYFILKVVLVDDLGFIKKVSEFNLIYKLGLVMWYSHLYSVITIDD